MPCVIVHIVCVCMCVCVFVRAQEDASNVCLWFAAMTASKEMPQVYIRAEPPHLAQWRFISVVKTHDTHTHTHTATYF